MEKNNVAPKGAEVQKSTTEKSVAATAGKTTPVPATTGTEVMNSKTLDALIKERTEQVRKQSELVARREVLMATREELVRIAQSLAEDVKADNFTTKTARINIEVGDGYNSADKLVITNPALITGFVNKLCGDITDKVSAIERQLVG